MMALMTSDCGQMQAEEQKEIAKQARALAEKEMAEAEAAKEVTIAAKAEATVA